jgi:cobalt-zinc-cadmium efflux system protein
MEHEHHTHDGSHAQCDHGHHDHGHGHTHGGSRRSLVLSLIVTAGFMLIEAVGGWVTNSLALLSDAGHMLTDTAALGLSLLALRIGDMPPSTTKTFGYRRFEILVAFLNGLTLWAIVIVILHEAYERVQSPPEVRGLGMMGIALVGLMVNLVSIWLLHAHKDENLNVRGAFLHVLADSMGSVGALVASLVILATGWTLADPLVSVAICALILWSSWGIIRDSLNILLEGVPSHIDYREVQQALLQHEGVCCLYDLHIWSITGGREALSAHVVVPDGYRRQKELLQEILGKLKERFGIDHATLQIEETHEMREEYLLSGNAVCAVPSEGGAACKFPAAWDNDRP